MTAAVVGCTPPPSGPPTATENSTARAGLAERIQFVENYVAFRRTYQALDYDVAYHNNDNGRVPGPSDWDIRLVAQVPAAELNEWIPSDVEPVEQTPPDWLSTVPGPLGREGIDEWYFDQGREIGIDRENSIVAYRNFAN